MKYAYETDVLRAIYVFLDVTAYSLVQRCQLLGSRCPPFHGKRFQSNVKHKDMLTVCRI